MLLFVDKAVLDSWHMVVLCVTKTTTMAQISIYEEIMVVQKAINDNITTISDNLNILTQKIEALEGMLTSLPIGG